MVIAEEFAEFVEAVRIGEEIFSVRGTVFFKGCLYGGEHESELFFLKAGKPGGLSSSDADVNLHDMVVVFSERELFERKPDVARFNLHRFSEVIFVVEMLHDILDDGVWYLCVFFCLDGVEPFLKVVLSFVTETSELNFFTVRYSGGCCL